MPGELNGLQATQAIINAGTGKPIKVIGVTSYESDEAIQRCYDAGMVAVITKPLNGDLLQEAFNQHY